MGAGLGDGTGDAGLGAGTGAGTAWQGLRAGAVRPPGPGGASRAGRWRPRVAGGEPELLPRFRLPTEMGYSGSEGVGTHQRGRAREGRVAPAAARARALGGMAAAGGEAAGWELQQEEEEAPPWSSRRE